MRNEKQKKVEKVIYLTEVDETILKKDILKSEKLIGKFKGSYQKFMKELLNEEKSNLQIRTFCIEMLLRTLINEANLPVYIAIGMLEKIKTETLTPRIVFPKQNIKKRINYVG